jgi:predicted secreted protein
LSDTYVNVPLLVDVAYGMKGEDVIEIVVFTNPCPVIVGVPFVIVKTAEISL